MITTSASDNLSVININTLDKKVAREYIKKTDWQMADFIFGHKTIGKHSHSVIFKSRFSDVGTIVPFTD